MELLNEFRGRWRDGCSQHQFCRRLFPTTLAEKVLHPPGNLPSLLHSERPVIVATCHRDHPTCRHLIPKLAIAADALANRASFVVVDCAAHPSRCEGRDMKKLPSIDAMKCRDPSCKQLGVVPFAGYEWCAFGFQCFLDDHGL